MTAPAWCTCGHPLEQHHLLSPQCSARGCTCLKYRAATPRGASMKTCNKCHEVKPRDEFYPDHGKCKDCENSRPRERKLTKFIRSRARNRATAELVARHQDEFNALLDLYTEECAKEAEELGGETVRLRPGKRRSGQTTVDRVDVGRCPECAKHHDRGHVCPNCGASPHTERTEAS